jgi:hypothetical protein
MLQGILEGEGPVGHYLKVLKGVLLIERFVAGSSFLAPRFWAYVPGRFVLGSSVLALRVLGALGAPGALGRLTL